MKTLTLIGAGKLAQTLARLWQVNGQFAIQQVLTRSLLSAEAACDFIGGGEAIAASAALRPADVWLVATPDSDIAATAAHLRQLQYQQQPLLQPGTVLFHCSGALSSTVLADEASIAVASVHPIHSFASPAESVQRFAGSFCGYEGGTTALAVLKPAFTAIGAQLFAIDGEQKTVYHAASVIACNYLVSLMEASLSCFEAAGVSRSQAQQLLLPITHQTLDNTLMGSPSTALTGPISRGDVDTVQQQLTQLRSQNPLLGQIYASLGLQAVSVAKQQDNRADPQQLDAIRLLLENAASLH